jgi:dienelactone hydrolase
MRVALLVLLATVTTLGCGGGGATAHAARPTPAATDTAARATAPDGYDNAGGTWFHVTTGSRSLLVDVQAPPGAGPFPVVLFVPGDIGLDPSEVRWAGRLAAAGYLVVLACSPDSTTPPVCHTPDRPSLSSVDDLVLAAALVPGARKGPAGVFGMSLGAAVALQAAGRRTDLAAVVADSTVRGCVQPSRVPVLLLASQTDASYGPSTDCAKALGTVETQFYPNGDHVVALSAGTGDDATARIVRFLDQHLK